MMNKPLVTISIPTYNSEKFLSMCLDAIRRQTYQNIEINIVDGASTDRTIAIANSYGVQNIIVCEDALLKARYEGILIAKGEYILLLDSDQILEPNAIEACVEAAGQKYDMLVLEEEVYKNENWIEHLFQLDRKLVHKVQDFNPYTSVMLPRFYNTELLKKAFSNIPEDVLRKVGGQDHAIIYFEVWQLSQKVSLVGKAVKHIEPDSLKTIYKKFYRWGYSSTAAHDPRYKELLERKERFRKGIFSDGQFKESFGSILLLLLKGIPYYIGYISRRLKNH